MSLPHIYTPWNGKECEESATQPSFPLHCTQPTQVSCWVYLYISASLAVVSSAIWALSVAISYSHSLEWQGVWTQCNSTLTLPSPLHCTQPTRVSCWVCLYISASLAVVNSAIWALSVASHIHTPWNRKECEHNATQPSLSPPHCIVHNLPKFLAEFVYLCIFGCSKFSYLGSQCCYLIFTLPGIGRSVNTAQLNPHSPLPIALYTTYPSFLLSLSISASLAVVSSAIWALSVAISYSHSLKRGDRKKT